MGGLTQFLDQLPAEISKSQQDWGGWTIAVENAEQLKFAIRLANEMGTQFCFSGGNAASSDVICLDYTPMHQVKAHLKEEFLVTVESGLTIDSLNQFLQSSGQTLLQSYPPYRTVLEILSEDLVPINAIRSRPIRYCVTGIEALTWDAQRIHYGGVVVKNVTGYEMPKLFVGSCNQFGVITQATLRVVEKPQAKTAFLFYLEQYGHVERLSRHHFRVLSTLDTLICFKTKGTFGWQLLVLLSGSQSQLQLDTQTIMASTKDLDPGLQTLNMEQNAVSQWINRLDWSYFGQPEALVIQIYLPSNTLQQFTQWLLHDVVFQSADMLLVEGVNAVCLRWAPVSLPTTQDLERLKQESVSQGGLLKVVRVPYSRKTGFYNFNQPDNPVMERLEQALKGQFDPNQVFYGSTSMTKSENIPAGVSK